MPTMPTPAEDPRPPDEHPHQPAPHHPATPATYGTIADAVWFDEDWTVVTDGDDDPTWTA